VCRGKTPTAHGTAANQQRLWSELWLRAVSQTRVGAEDVDFPGESERQSDSKLRQHFNQYPFINEKMSKRTLRQKMGKTRICAAEMAVRYAALAEKYMCVIVIR